MAVLVAAAVALSFTDAIPGKLPGVALGSPAILRLERIAAAMAVLLVAFTLVIRAFQGDLPVELSGRGVKWTPRETTERIQGETAIAVQEIRQSVSDLRDATAETFEEVFERLESTQGRE
jgi:hypothetical protein